MKLSITAAILCLTPILTVSADDMHWSDTKYRTMIIRPVAIDAFGHALQMPPVTVLVPVRDRTITLDDSSRQRVSDAPRPVAVQRRTSPSKQHVTNPRPVPNPFRTADLTAVVDHSLATGRSHVRAANDVFVGVPSRAAEPMSDDVATPLDWADVEPLKPLLVDSRVHRRSLY